MKLLSKNIEELTTDDINKIIQIKEYEMLDFKEDVSIKRHIHEDICAFANTFGGHLILGIKNNPREFIGIEDPEMKINQVISSCNSNIVGPLPFISHKSIEVNPSKFCVVLGIEKNKEPCAVKVGDRDKFFYRSGNSTEEIKKRGELMKIFGLSVKEKNERNLKLILIEYQANCHLGTTTLCSKAFYLKFNNHALIAFLSKTEFIFLEKELQTLFYSLNEIVMAYNTLVDFMLINSFVLMHPHTEVPKSFFDIYRQLSNRRDDYLKKESLLRSLLTKYNYNV